VRNIISPVPTAGGDGQIHLAYELQVSNFYKSTGTMSLDQLDVFGDDDSKAIVSYLGPDLDSRVQHPGAARESRWNRSIEGGASAVVYIWISLPNSSSVPHRLRHRAIFTNDKKKEEIVEGVLVDTEGLPIVIGPPIRNGIWLVHNGPGNPQTSHWGSILARNGTVTLPERFAIDFMGVNNDGRTIMGDPTKTANRDWTGYGAEVIAVADAVVEAARDGIDELPPLVEPPPPPDMTIDAVGGNYIVLKLNAHHFAFYAHMIPGSIQVKRGERVRRGQVLGRLGNSGNTNAPHLHFHIGTSNLFETAEGLPFVIEGFDSMGSTTVDKTIGNEQPERPSLKSRRRREVPLDGAMVRFP
jgi:hypothetical protein